MHEICSALVQDTQLLYSLITLQPKGREKNGEEEGNLKEEGDIWSGFILDSLVGMA